MVVEISPWHSFDRVGGVIEDSARTIATFVNRVSPLTLTVNDHLTSASLVDSSGHVIA